MKIVSTIEELRTELAKSRKSGKLIGCVPTMGALHEGHMALVKKSAAQNDVTVVTIFVNPLQFGKNLCRHTLAFGERCQDGMAVRGSVGGQAGCGVALKDDIRRHAAASPMVGGGQDERDGQTASAVGRGDPQVGAVIEADDLLIYKKRRAPCRGGIADAVAELPAATGPYWRLPELRGELGEDGLGLAFAKPDGL